MSKLDYILKGIALLDKLFISNISSFESRVSENSFHYIYTCSDIEKGKHLFTKNTVLPEGYLFNCSENQHITGISCSINTIWGLDGFKKFIKDAIVELYGLIKLASENRIREAEKNQLRYYLSILRSRFSHVLDEWKFSINRYEKDMFTPYTRLPDGCILCFDTNQIATAIRWEYKSVRENDLVRDYIEKRIMSIFIVSQICAFSSKDGEAEIHVRWGEIQARLDSGNTPPFSNTKIEIAY